MEVSLYYRFPAFISFNYKISWEEGTESEMPGKGAEPKPMKESRVRRGAGSLMAGPPDAL